MTGRPPPRSCFGHGPRSHTATPVLTWLHPHFLPQEVECTSLRGACVHACAAQTHAHTHVYTKHTQLYPLTFQDPATIMACFQPSSSHIHSDPWRQPLALSVTPNTRHTHSYRLQQPEIQAPEKGTITPLVPESLSCV